MINETKRQQENQTKILEIQTSLVFGSRKEVNFLLNLSDNCRSLNFFNPLVDLYHKGILIALVLSENTSREFSIYSMTSL